MKVLIFHCQGAEKILQEICAGLEEEGVPWQVWVGQEPDAEVLAQKAARVSTLGVGIGVSKAFGVLTAMDLPSGYKLYETLLETKAQGRILGKNGARVVKRKVMV